MTADRRTRAVRAWLQALGMIGRRAADDPDREAEAARAWRRGYEMGRRSMERENAWLRAQLDRENS